MTELPHSAHWGRFLGGVDAAGTLAVRPHPEDSRPSPLLANIENAPSHRARVARPAIRRGWLEDGPGPDERRGRDDFVSVSWAEALDRLAAELRRVVDETGPQSVFGGSYGWSSAGRFHHAQSQIHRFLNTALGGYVRSVNSYSGGAAEVVLPHLLGPLPEVSKRNVTWEQIVGHTDTVLALGGMALKNTMIGTGGVGRRVEHEAMREAARRGTRFVLVGPLRGDLPADVPVDWIPARPGTDAALLLALAHTVVSDGLVDEAFVRGWCEGYEEYRAFLVGDLDGTVRDAGWAESITEVPAERIRELARTMAAGRSLVTVAQSLQRAEHGEQPIWAAINLAALLGQIGLPGGGFNYGLGSLAQYGRRHVAAALPTLDQGTNGVADFIPVARIADMLLHPGEEYDYNGERRTYPAVRLAYWAGGNPFHHHQDLNRLRRAVRRLETFVVHESAWTATARHADVVLPATLTVERDDIGAATHEPTLVAMHALTAPHAEARDDYDIFAGLADRLGTGEDFTEGRGAREWLRHLYERTRSALAAAGQPAPSFEEFWSAGEVRVPQVPDDGGILRAFREDPQGRPLPTPSGRVQLTSAAIAGFGYPDCPGHPTWLPPADAPDERHPLWLIANQPASRLHSQLDFGNHSQAQKVGGREAVRIHPQDAAERGIDDGDVVRLFNDRGACLAAASLSDAQRRGVVNLSTGAWYAPDRPEAEAPLCLHGNPNVLTRDAGTSSLAQGSTGSLTAVQLERHPEVAPPDPYSPPPMAPAPARPGR